MNKMQQKIHRKATQQPRNVEAYESYKLGFTIGAAGRPQSAFFEYPSPPHYEEAENGFRDGTKMFNEHMRVTWERLGKPTVYKVSNDPQPPPTEQDRKIAKAIEWLSSDEAKAKMNEALEKAGLSVDDLEKARQIDWRSLHEPMDI